MCREKPNRGYLLVPLPGSPLRVQGKGDNKGSTGTGIRITPACAGKSRYGVRRLGDTQDHPCVCREKVTLSGITTACRGSPLRVQGKGMSFWRISSQIGITPACAGKRLKNPRKIAVLIFANVKFHLVSNKLYLIICNHQQPYAFVHHLCQDIWLPFPAYSFPDHLFYF